MWAFLVIDTVWRPATGPPYRGTKSGDEAGGALDEQELPDPRMCTTAGQRRGGIGVGLTARMALHGYSMRMYNTGVCIFWY